MQTTEKYTQAFESDFDNYSYGKKEFSKLKTSNYNLNSVRKTIIKMSLEYEIIDIRTYAGYKGDLIVQIIAESQNTLEVLQKNAIRLGMESTIKKNDNLLTYELYCMYPHDVYTLKPEIQ